MPMRGERVLNGAVCLKVVEEDEERIPATQEESIYDFEEITGIPYPPTVKPTRHSKRLREKRGGQTTNSDRYSHSHHRERHCMSISTKVCPYSRSISLTYYQIKFYLNLYKLVTLIWGIATTIEP